eukprot:TRINITY_DN8820_c0_g1_i1.p1 TRINITY_DN8820_c0_g1~~TRINITY_DN8820_c0_g1_i1.p1  ORF type:complete len:441 (-),score=68.91 TRINITY_DN8820_c0_g1_i1:250-1443(-)
MGKKVFLKGVFEDLKEAGTQTIDSVNFYDFVSEHIRKEGWMETLRKKSVNKDFIDICTLMEVAIKSIANSNKVIDHLTGEWKSFYYYFAIVVFDFYLQFSGNSGVNIKEFVDSDIFREFEKDVSNDDYAGFFSVSKFNEANEIFACCEVDEPGFLNKHRVARKLGCTEAFVSAFSQRFPHGYTERQDSLIFDNMVKLYMLIKSDDCPLVRSYFFDILDQRECGYLSKEDISIFFEDMLASTATLSELSPIELADRFFEQCNAKGEKISKSECLSAPRFYDTAKIAVEIASFGNEDLAIFRAANEVEFNEDLILSSPLTPSRFSITSSPPLSHSHSTPSPSPLSSSSPLSMTPTRSHSPSLSHSPFQTEYDLIEYEINTSSSSLPSPSHTVYPDEIFG